MGVNDINDDLYFFQFFWRVWGLMSVDANRYRKPGLNNGVYHLNDSALVPWPICADRSPYLSGKCLIYIRVRWSKARFTLDTRRTKI
jgi:hypothetical protein